MKKKTKFSILCPNWSFSLDNQKYLDENGIECIEEWKWIKGYKNLYEISNLGRLKTHNWRGAGRVMIVTPKVTSDGYLAYRLSKNNFDKRITAHRLVAIAFNGGLKKSLEVNHKDGIKVNNYPSNLEWVTHAENMVHFGEKIYKKGEWSNFGKKSRVLKINVVIDIRSGKYNHLHTAELARKLKVSWNTIDCVRKGKTYPEIKQIESVTFQRWRRKPLTINPLIQQIA